MSTRRCASLRFAATRQLTSGDVRSFVRKLSAHIRKEERDLFERMQKLLSIEELCRCWQSPGGSTGQLFPILHYSWRSDSPPPKGFRLLNPSGFRVHLASYESGN